jgi:hypothetical protein
VERPEIEVLRVRADMKGAGPVAAFALLESKIHTLRGRRFYGTFQFKAHGEEYYACVEKVDSDNPVTWSVEAGVIPGGLYLRRKLAGSEDNIPQLPRHFREMLESSEAPPPPPPQPV